jgi:hypothetical protein
MHVDPSRCSVAASNITGESTGHPQRTGPYNTNDRFDRDVGQGVPYRASQNDGRGVSLIAGTGAFAIG